MEQYDRSPVDKCIPHPYPHRLLLGQTGFGSTLLQAGEAQLADRQDSFDYLWNGLSIEVDQSAVTGTTIKPVINWEHEAALFYRFSLSNTCQKVKPFGDEMVTDCYSITLPVLRYMEGKDCRPAMDYPVFIYIFPKAKLPISVQWVDLTPTPTPVPAATPFPTATPTPEPDEGGE